MSNTLKAALMQLASLTHFSWTLTERGASSHHRVEKSKWMLMTVWQKRTGNWNSMLKTLALGLENFPLLSSRPGSQQIGEVTASSAICIPNLTVRVSGQLGPPFTVHCHHRFIYFLWFYFVKMFLFSTASSSSYQRVLWSKTDYLHSHSH